MKYIREKFMGIIMAILMAISMTLAGCDGTPMSTVQQAEAIRVCNEEGLDWMPRYGAWHGASGGWVGVDCVKPDLRPAAPKNIGKCIAEGIDDVYTDMDVVLLEAECRGEI
jgi:hypothetical protein